MLSKENALRSVLQFVGSDVGCNFDLDDARGEELAHRLQMRVKNNIVMSPEAVLPHAQALFPPEDADYVRRNPSRVVPPRQQQPKQTRDEINAEIAAYFNQGWWSQMAPGTIPAITSDAKVGSMKNHEAFVRAVDARITRGEPINRDFLNLIVLNLFQGGVLEKPQPVAAPPPPSPAEQARELAKKQYDFSRKINDRDTSPIKGAKEAAKLLVDPKPVLTEEQRIALNEKKRAEDATIAEAASRIDGYSSYTHSRTFSGRAQLREVFQASMDAGKSATDVLAAVVAKIDQLTDNGSIR